MSNWNYFLFLTYFHRKNYELLKKCKNKKITTSSSVRPAAKTSLCIVETTCISIKLFTQDFIAANCLAIYNGQQITTAQKFGHLEFELNRTLKARINSHLYLF